MRNMITMGEFIVKKQADYPTATGELTSLLSSIRLAAKVVNREINKAGLVLALDDYFVDGLLAFADLGGDYYRLKSPGAVVGRRTGRLYRLGDRLAVTLASVNPLERRMTLALSSVKPKERR